MNKNTRTILFILVLMEILCSSILRQSSSKRIRFDFLHEARGLGLFKIPAYLLAFVDISQFPKQLKPESSLCIFFAIVRRSEYWFLLNLVS